METVKREGEHSKRQRRKLSRGSGGMVPHKFLKI